MDVFIYNYIFIYGHNYIYIYMYLGIIYFLNHFESNPQTPVWYGQHQLENWLPFLYRPPGVHLKHRWGWLFLIYAQNLMKTPLF